MKTKTNQKSVKMLKRSRGYRLKPETHTLIVKIQNLLGSDQDEAIAAACTMLYNNLKKNNPESAKK